MELADVDSRRWVCSKDGTTFLVTEGWTTDVPTPKPAIPQAQILTPKSYAAGFVANLLLPGAGVIYAGKRVGLVYVVLTVVFIVVAWPLSIVVAAFSHIHTIIAVSERNNQIKKIQLNQGPKQIAPNVSVPVIGNTTNCVKCGSPINLNSAYCRYCGARTDGSLQESSAADKTRVY